jgi:uncharacterized membrane protein
LSTLAGKLAPHELGRREHQVTQVARLATDSGQRLLYRSGFEVSLGALVTQTAAAMLLVGIGVLVFREKLSLSHGFGIVLCLAGLWLVNRR